MSAVRTLFFGCLAAATLATLRAQAPAGTLPTVLAAPGNTSLALGTTSSTDLSAVFGLPGVAGQVVQMQTTQGVINIELFPQTTPLTVANFLYYVTGGFYTNSLINRSVPGFVIQGGGFTITAPSSINTIPTKAAVQNEFHLSNVRGTLAMAKLGTDPNSATDQWFINLADNSGNLDNQNGGFTVFARVIGTGMTVADAIAALPTYNLSASLTADFTNTPLANVSGSSVVYANWVRLPTVAPVSIYPDTGTSGVLSFSAASSSPNTVNAATVGRTLILYASSPGTAAITVTASDGNGNQASTVFNVTVAPFAFTSQPVSQTVATGSTVVFSAPASAAATYQWQFNGAPLLGATSSRLVISPTSAANIGSYACVAASSSAGTITSQAATLALSSTADIGRLINLSVLTPAGAGDANLLTVGLTTGGGTSGQQPLLIRGIGPALSAFNLSTPLQPDPTLTVINQNSHLMVTSNDNWGTPATNASVVTTADGVTFAFPLNDPNSLDAATVTKLDPGGYSVQISANGSAVGNVLAEVYDYTTNYTPASPRLINLSCRSTISGSGSVTAGFTIGGSTSRTVLVRATGPALAALGVSGTMPDPQIVLVASGATSPLATNAGWGGDSQIVTVSNSVGAFPITDPNSKDSVVLVTLPPGGYTATASSVSGTGGAALIEVYEVP